MKVHSTEFKHTCGQARRWRYLENLQFSDRYDDVTCKVCLEKIQGWSNLARRIEQSLTAIGIAGHINHEAIPACNSCHYYCGSGHLPCAVHPYLQVDCPDFQQKEEVVAGTVVAGINGWYRVVPRRHIDSTPALRCQCDSGLSVLSCDRAHHWRRLAFGSCSD